MAPKSIFRQPGAQHFQLVHRSQRDPRINDPSASKHVLKSFERDNAKKGKTRAELEDILGDDALSARENVGEASLYGIYYDDTDYDYMQHLRPVGADEAGVEATLLEAPSSSKTKRAGKQREDLTLRLPADALPSAHQRSQLEAQDSLLAVPSTLAGFQPDMDPHLRQTLEALEDDDFVTEDEDDVEEGLFGELLGGGELGEGEELEFEFAEWGVEGDEDGRPPIAAGKESREGGEEGDEDDLRARVAAFKHSHRSSSPHSAGSAAEDDTEAADTLPPLAVIGGKRRRKGARSDASGYSMSSASVWRGEGLQLLDERFDQVEKAYDDEYEDEDEDGENEELKEMEDDEDDEDGDEAPELVSRDDFNSIMDEFLTQYEQVGHTVRPALHGATGTEKLDTLRRALGSVTLQQAQRVMAQTDEDEDGDDQILMPVDIDDAHERWDCETILSTYTNMENHPAIIRARDTNSFKSAGVRKIRLDPRTGLPAVDNAPTAPLRKRDARDADVRRQAPGKAPVATVARPKDESKEEKKARKAAVKGERQARRTEKKATKTAFSTERKAQLKAPPTVTASILKL